MDTINYDSEVLAARTAMADTARLSQGALLAAARTARGMSVGDVASRLKLSVAQVRAIEGDDHAKLPAPVFVRGFVRNYARLVGLEMAKLLPDAATVSDNDKIVLQENSNLLMKRAPGAAIDMEPRRHRRLPLWAASAAVLLLGLTYYTFVMNPPPVSYQYSSTAPVSTSSSVMSTTDNININANPNFNPGSESVPENRSTMSTVADNLQLKKSTDPTSGAGDKGLHFLFNGESWVEVRDGVGKIVFSRINAPGSESIVRGDPPFSVVIGSASGVQLSYNGSQIDLTSHANAGVARLRIE